jgi:hypothetical protein
MLRPASSFVGAYEDRVLGEKGQKSDPSIPEWHGPSLIRQPARRA